MYLAESNTYRQEVKTVQELLNRVRQTNHFSNKWGIIKADGFYGPKTKEAVLAFQKATGIQQTGIVGDQTFNALKNALPSIYESPSTCYMTQAPAKQYITSTPPKSHISQSANGSLHNGKNPNLSADQSLFQILDFIAKKIVKPFSDTLKSASDQATNELKSLQGVKKMKISDIQRIANSMFQRPDVARMRETIVNEVYEELSKRSRGNSNVTNYNKSKIAYSKVADRVAAQRQLKKGLDRQTIASINKQLGKLVTDRCVSELETVQFDKILSEKIGKVGKNAKNVKGVKGGGGILTALTLFPLCLHTIELIYNTINGLPVKDVITKIVSDIISIVVGILIGAAIAAVVALIGLTGGVAVLVVVVVGLIVGLILSLFFGDWEDNIAKKFVNWIYNTIQRPNIMDIQSGLVYA